MNQNVSYMLNDPCFFFPSTVAPVTFKISRWDKNNPPQNSFETHYHEQLCASPRVFHRSSSVCLYLRFVCSKNIYFSRTIPPSRQTKISHVFKHMRLKSPFIYSWIINSTRTDFPWSRARSHQFKSRITFNFIADE